MNGNAQQKPPPGPLLRLRIAALLLCGTIAAAVATAAPAEDADRDRRDVLFANGPIYTVDPARPWAEAVLVRDGRIDFVGTAAEARARAAADTRTIDLRGRLLLPGFVESHSHPAVAGLFNSKLSLIGTETLADVQRALGRYALAHPDEEVLFGFGFPSALNTQVHRAGVTGPHRMDLDDVVADRSVMLIALDAHSAWLNSAALATLGITEATPDPLPGVYYYQRDERGHPTGWMVEGGAFWPLLARLGIGSREDFREALSRTLPAYSAMGITTVFDAGIPGGETMLRNALGALRSMEHGEGLPLRYRASYYLGDPAIEGSELVRRVATLRRELSASPRIDLHTVKIPNDGTLEGETAALLTPYASGGSGAIFLSGEPLARILAALRGADLDAHIHAIGDRTLRVTLDALATARTAVPRSEGLVVIAHAMLAAPEDLRRLGELGVLIQTTPHWAHDLGGSFALYTRLLDGDRAGSTMRLRDLWEATPSLAFGADYPATGLPFAQSSPLYGIEIGHTRRKPGAVGEGDGPPLPPEPQRMALADMVRGATQNGARQLHLAEEIGSITPGKWADLIVLERDLFHTPAHRIHAIQVEMTMLAGRIVFQRGAP